MSKRSREESSWCTIESDPGIFTLLIEKLGVKGVQVEEIYDLESNSLVHLPEIYGFIFLFKWTRPSEQPEECQISDCGDIFFARQEISNACATQAILHILLNLSENVELGEVLNNFKAFAQDLPADMRGLCLSNSLEIRQIHNEFGNLEELLAFGDEDENEKEDKPSKDPFHFVAFIKKNEKIYELDGLKEGPIVHSKLTSELDLDSDWKGKVLEVIKKRVGEGGEIRFNLMALVKDQRESLRNEIEKIETEVEHATEEERSKLVARRFKAQQCLEDEESKWKEYRKSWSERQKNSRAAHTPQIKLSSKVQDLLKSMAAKGLIPK